MTSAWFWQLPTLLAIVTTIVLYGRGRVALRARWTDGDRPVRLSRTHMALFAISQLSLIIALFSPLQSWASELFVFHVSQHLLLAAVTPALFWFSDPLPILKAGLPRSWQQRLTASLAPGAPLWEMIKKLTPKGVVWILFVSIVWFWYDGAVHVATLTRPWLHLLELVTVFAAANLYWWHITVAAPHIHQPLPSFVHMVFALGGAWPIKAVGAAAIFTENVFYAYPPALLARWGVSPFDNQQWGGILIWGFGGIAFTTSAAFYLRRWLGAEEAKPARKLDEMLTEENMLMPGVKR
ncbi:MAG: cytochrome c oxidase assembly protein [Anaerolineales bacterium]|nr:cytochrome c oxidase assembly protein [Anaerolineales bacterium]MCB0020782.1 cytochrome c oxidase assembly protein [Anaerolineales bacterium]